MHSLFRNLSDVGPVQQAMQNILANSQAIELPPECEVRLTDRFNICIPIAITAYPISKTAHWAVQFAATKEVSAQGVRFISSESFCSADGVVASGQELLCGFHVDTPWILRSAVRHSQPFGGNLFEVGVKFTDVVPADSLPRELLAEFSRLSV